MMNRAQDIISGLMSHYWMTVENRERKES